MEGRATASIGGSVDRERREFLGLESKRFLWNFGYLLKELLRIEKLSRGSALKLHSLAFSGLQIRDAAAIYSRVEVRK